MNQEKLYNFLIEAKKRTYANENIEKQKSSRNGSYDYEHRSGNMIYHDTYFGGTNFIGEEVVYEDGNTPVWGMNYYGVTLDQTLSEEVIDKALRPALMRVGSDDTIPVRGPKEYVNGEYQYNFKVVGDLEYFEGEETIYKADKKVYVLKCHGGAIKNHN